MYVENAMKKPPSRNEGGYLIFKLTITHTN